VTVLSGALALWNYHLAPMFAPICNKDSPSVLCVYWRTAHRVNDPTFGLTERLLWTEWLRETSSLPSFICLKTWGPDSVTSRGVDTNSYEYLNAVFT